MARLSLLHPRSSLFISPWLERSVLSFSFNQTASYCSSRRAGRINQKTLGVFDKSEALGNHLLMEQKFDEHRVVSPLSLQVVLSLLAAGSRGWTSRQIVNFFNADSVDHLNSLASLISDVILANGDPAVGPRVRCSNALWLDQSLSLKPSFKHVLESDYRAAVNPVDFQTKAAHVGQEINSWVENGASVRVKDLIREGSLNNSVKLVFTNALNFTGAWEEKANPSNHKKKKRRKKADLIILRKELGKNEYKVTAPFIAAKMEVIDTMLFHKMHTLGHTCKKQAEEKRAFSMHFYYPHSFDYEFYEEPDVYTVDINGITTPIFSMSSEVEASEVLRALGMRLLFSEGKLTEMVTSLFDGEDQLYVFGIFQKTFIQVNKKGTKAATATAAIVMSGRPPDLPPVRRIVELHPPCLLPAGQFDSDASAKTELKVHQIFSRLPKY
ncbi:serpin-ZX-like [Neltuma alba]|uniref:serpin-ZX-like n=1 Tax=Neltuma alba TaxID=207710 RepID=UPI0010A407C4|nr:serpin-ZX-like [Prosopis alba]